MTEVVHAPLVSYLAMFLLVACPHSVLKKGSKPWQLKSSSALFPSSCGVSMAALSLLLSWIEGLARFSGHSIMWVE